MFKIMFKTMFEKKIKKMANKNMSFLKITDPKKRDFIVNEFLKTRRNIQQNFLSKRVGNSSTPRTFKAFQTSHRYAKRFKRRSCKRIKTN